MVIAADATMTMGPLILLSVGLLRLDQLCVLNPQRARWSRVMAR